MLRLQIAAFFLARGFTGLRGVNSFLAVAAFVLDLPCNVFPGLFRTGQTGIASICTSGYVSL